VPTLQALVSRGAGSAGLLWRKSKVVWSILCWDEASWQGQGYGPETALWQALGMCGIVVMGSEMSLPHAGPNALLPLTLHPYPALPDTLNVSHSNPSCIHTQFLHPARFPSPIFSLQLIGLVFIFIYALFGIQFFAERSEVLLACVHRPLLSELI
jgi:hypothetical protein